jgi:predicted PhzF superfamily epimerase YddE/YHI9
MEIEFHQVDAFASRPFTGNPAAVVVRDAWLPDPLMQQIAMEMNLSETAFVGPGDDGGLRIRWFTPAVEVDLCGHATLASAHVLGRDHVRLASRSGGLEVRRDGDLLVLDFPARPPRRCDDAGLAERLADALGRAPREVLLSRDAVAVFDDAATVRELAPDMTRLAAIDVHGVIVTAPGDRPGLDFVSRFFVPQQGIPEDPVTGSAHCTLIPWWAERLGKPELLAHQVSRRGGELRCRLRGDRVDIGGRAVTVARGVLLLP